MHHLHTPIRIAALLLCQSAIHIPHSAFAQGSLVPPGPPAPSMLTLDQIEPRTPVPAGTNTVVLSKSGSYYLTGDLMTTGTAIHIVSDDITVDLNGFAITGTATNGASDIGIFIEGTSDSGRRNVTVQNGFINGFASSVWLDHTIGCRLHRLVTQGSRGSSIFLDGRNGGPCHGNQVTQCRMANGLRGIRLQGENGECSGNLIAECIISGSGDQAVMFDPSNGNCSGNVFRECSISDPFYSCVYIVPTGGGKCHGNTFDRCTFNGANGGSGITVFTIGGSFNGNVIRECAVSDTSGAGISFSTGTGECLNNSVVGCVIQSTGSTAIDLSASVNAPVAGNLIRDNVIRQATDQGIWLVGAEANRIEANHLSRPTGSGYGIRSSSTADNVIVKNSSDDASVNFSISINDTYGPVVTTTGLLSDTGNDSHPWANYGF